MTVKKIMSGYIYRAFREKELYIMFFLNIVGSLCMSVLLFSSELPENNIVLLYYAFVIPSVNAAVFVLMHENALFANGTINNLITIGCKKLSVYFAHLLMALFADVFFTLSYYLIVLLTQVVTGKFIKISVSSLVLIMLLSLMVSFVIMAFTIFAHFTSRRAVVALIMTGVFVFGLNTLTVSIVESAVMQPEHEIDYDSPQMNLMRSALQEDSSRVNWDIDPFTLKDHVYLDGTEIDIYSKKVNPDAIRGTKRKALIAVMQGSPFTHIMVSYSVQDYRDMNVGYHLFGIGVDLAWFAVITAAGALIFRKSNLK